MNSLRILIIALASTLAFTYSSEAAKTDRAGISKQFQEWLKQFKNEAIEKGISEKAIEKAFAGVTLQWKLPDLDLPSAKKKEKVKSKKIKRQPEFASPGNYFPKAYLNTLSKRSRKIFKKWKDSLVRIERKYGVDAKIVLSIWGRETSFGRAKLPHYAIEVLVTQAFMGRRKDYFKNELFIALQILDQGHITPKEMKSSWAGAMGYTQFMPDDFRRYAVDFDGDGKRDIWKNIKDSLASTANYLAQNGWKKDVSWGYEVKLPKKFDCRHEGFDKGKSVSQWQHLGVSRTGKNIFSKKLLKEKAYLLIPGGTRGPAFLVFDNFLVLKTYNQANLYALFVGHLADRITRNKSFIGRWPKLKTYSRSHMRSVQEKLAALGYDIGKIDGIIGPKSRSIIGDFQNEHKLGISCYPNSKFFTYLTKKYQEKKKDKAVQ